MKRVRKIAFIGIFIAMEIVLTKYFVLMPSSRNRIGLAFVAYGLAGYLFGIKFSMTTALFTDLIGAFLFPQGPYFIGFSISALTNGFMYGLLKKYNKSYHVVLIIIVKALIVELFMNTLWLTIMFKSDFVAMLISRLPGIGINVVMRLLILVPLIAKIRKQERFNEIGY